jgi:predicted phosphodiesterase
VVVMVDGVFTVAHLSDVWLGYRDKASLRKVAPDSLDGKAVPVRELDGYVAWDSTISGVIADGADAVVIAGDLFYEPHPSYRALAHALSGLRRLSDAGIPVYVIAGNRDSDAASGDVPYAMLAHQPDAGIYVHSEPYQTYQLLQEPNIVLHMVSHSMYDESTEVMKQVKPVADAINIFTTHGTVVDPDRKERIKLPDTIREKVISDIFLNAGWDVMMLGHLSERGYVGAPEDKVFYSGSLIRRGFSDSEGELGRGYTLWRFDLVTGGVVQELRSVVQRPQFDLEPICAEGMDSSALTEAILDNLGGVSVEGGAPIVRQVVVGVAPSVLAGRDQVAIERAAGFALSFSLVPRAVVRDEVPAGGVVGGDAGGGFGGVGSVVEWYDRWVGSGGCETLRGIGDPVLVDEVRVAAGEYIRRGEEVVLGRSLGS